MDVATAVEPGITGEGNVSRMGDGKKDEKRPARPGKKEKKKMLNKVMLIGRLGADPEVRYTQSGTPVANFNIATSERFTNKDGEKEERTEWHRIVAWSRLAEICQEYLAKGKLVYIEGKLRTRSWDDRDGVKHYTTEILSQSMQMLDRAGTGNGSSNAGKPPQSDGPVPEDDDIPF